MRRSTYLLLLLVPFAVGGAIGAAFGDEDFKLNTQIIAFLIVFYIPPLTIFRMRSIGLSWIQILLSLVPFYGLKYSFKVFTEK